MSSNNWLECGLTLEHRVSAVKYNGIEIDIEPRLSWLLGELIKGRHINPALVPVVRARGGLSVGDYHAPASIRVYMSLIRSALKDLGLPVTVKADDEGLYYLEKVEGQTDELAA